MKIYITVSLLLQIYAASSLSILTNVDSSVLAPVETLTTIQDSIIGSGDVKGNVLFYVFCCNSVNPNVAQKVYNGYDSDLSDSCFNASSLTVFSIHGWTNYVNSPVNVLLRQAYCSVAEHKSHNVIVPDWSYFAQNVNYLIAAEKVAPVGGVIGSFIDGLYKTMNVKTTDVTLFGHSLGAHAAGVAGRTMTTGRLAAIFGLDPASPTFEKNGSNSEARLGPTDADCVQVLHTSAGTLGNADPLGDNDLWANGGILQPGCGVDTVCAHCRSYEYNAEAISAISNKKFFARSCDSWSNYTEGNCASNNYTYLGVCDRDNIAYGNYFFDTNLESPYAQD